MRTPEATALRHENDQQPRSAAGNTRIGKVLSCQDYFQEDILKITCETGQQNEGEVSHGLNKPPPLQL